MNILTPAERPLVRQTFKNTDLCIVAASSEIRDCVFENCGVLLYGRDTAITGCRLSNSTMTINEFPARGTMMVLDGKLIVLLSERHGTIYFRAATDAEKLAYRLGEEKAAL